MKTAVNVLSTRQTDFYLQARVCPPGGSQQVFVHTIHLFIHFGDSGEQDRQGPRLQAASFLLRNNIEIIPESAVVVI